MTMNSELEATDVEVPSTLAAQLAMTSALDRALMAAAKQASFTVLGEFVERNQLAPAGPPRVIYNSWGASTSLTVAFPIATAPAVVESARDIFVGTLAGGRALRFVHRGPYGTLRATYARIDAWLRQRGEITTDAGWTRHTGMWEEYFGEPRTMPHSALLTRIYLPIDRTSPFPTT